LESAQERKPDISIRRYFGKYCNSRSNTLYPFVRQWLAARVNIR